MRKNMYFVFVCVSSMEKMKTVNKKHIEALSKLSVYVRSQFIDAALLCHFYIPIAKPIQIRLDRLKLYDFI